MTVFTALYNLLIGPLELFYEVLFSIANRIIQNPGMTIIFLSLVVNFLVLPLYKQADAMQEEERRTNEKLEPWVKHIKKTFKGDERFMMMQTFYRQNHYKPTDALKGSLSLLLEIPFFIAAYNFLSELKLLQGVSFGPIQNLGAPDAMLVIAGVTINVLPILMTVINLIAGMIYTKGFPLKSKIQLYGMAVIFLVLLYDSPAGLVFYWTLNNLFSLAKNVFYKIKKPKLVLSILSSLTGAALLVFVLFVHPMASRRVQVLLIAGSLAMQYPVLAYFMRKDSAAKKVPQITGKNKITFHVACAFVTVLTGLLIPSALISASPQEFINIVTFSNPLVYILNSFLVAAGIFIVWFGIFYMLANPSGKKMMEFGMWALSGVAVVNYMFFGTNYGNISARLQFDVQPVFAVHDQVVNLMVVFAVVCVLYLIWRKKEELARLSLVAASLAMLGMSVFNIVNIRSITSGKLDDLQAASNEIASLPLSKDGQNVIVLMLDRAIGGYVPYVFNERPELAEKFDGFTYYGNTISYGSATNLGSPALFGGYEYTPAEINKRPDEPIAKKHDEALKVMPTLFNEEGFEITVCDAAYAGYNYIPDLSIFDYIPGVHTYNTMGKFNDMSVAQGAQMGLEETLYRNLFCYSIFKISPVFVQPALYTRGAYNNVDVLFARAEDGQTADAYTYVQNGMTKSTGISMSFIRSYAVLQNLPTITNVTEGGKNSFIMMCNDTTHDACLLQTPNYEPAVNVDNTEYDAAHADRFTVNGRKINMETENQINSYHAFMAAMIQLGNWFDYLRANGVYDNTRIIITSDHGYWLDHFDDLMLNGIDMETYNPVMFVKDFNGKGFQMDFDTFMTNADTPTMAMEGLIDNPVNPFTGKPINNDPKFNGEQIISLSRDWDPLTNNGNTFHDEGWVSVKDSIFDINNWKILNAG